ncbi:leucine-rich repeat protein [Ruminococcus flavefaciens]|uniref:Dockerin domain-containing protein n=1 Tax=Ruminococcus flavefaciens 007c TaxID=1341157 RepID=W7UHR4_RUMFL|nr:leucine-rich repeat protein [Ruminococcus flavefaciens]EWM54726.1 hypothetical protein RF007C_02285 [Ruminococcus flavefaciens 007c]
MSSSKKNKKFIASVMALSIITAGATSAESSIIRNIIPANTLSAEAANSNGWDYSVLSNGTVKLTRYTGGASYVTVPSSINNKTVSALGDNLFKDNTTIRSVTIPKGITELPYCCFWGATNLESVSLPSGLTTIWNCAFKDTKSLRSVTIPSTVKDIKFRAFWGSGITSFSASSLNDMGSAVFEDCKNLKSAYLQNGFTLTWDTFKGCSSLETVTLPNSLKRLGGGTFDGCVKLKSVTIPSSVYSLEKNAFKDCTSIQSVSIPSSVTDFGEAIFDGCTSLNNINISGISVFESLILNHSLKNTPNLTKINNESVVLYRSKRYSPIAEPYFNSKYSDFIYENFDITDADRPGFYEEFLKADIKYIVKTNTNSQQTDAQKAKALHDWVCNKVEYAFDEEGNPAHTGKEAIDSSVFMGDKAICEGYAQGLALLLNEAGIEAYTADNNGHLWNMAKIDGHYFHIDATWDDYTNSYNYFLKSDSVFSADGHRTWHLETANNSRLPDVSSIPLPECPYSVGDADRDGDIDKDDINFIQRYLLGLENIAPTDKVYADANLDGTIDMSDTVTLIQQYHLY